MANYDELPLYKASYDLLLETFRFVKDFTREYKYTIGQTLKEETVSLVMLIYKANCSEDKRDIIIKTREKLEKIRLIIRLVKDLHQISTKKFVHINKRVEIVSRQLVGWQKSVK
jgi:pyruvate/2-oxoacid:ferredoxin oxidoreductase alpha subunit